MAQATNSVDGTCMQCGYSDSDDVEANGAELQRVDTLTIDPALYEKLFLNPQTPVKGPLRQMFAVPTPM